MAKVLVVEIARDLRSAVILSAEGFAVLTTDDQDLTAAIRTVGPDVVLVEAGDEVLRGARACRVLRAVTAVPMVLLLSGATELEVLDAYGHGVDGVIGLPIGSHELVARVRAFARRVPAAAAPSGDRVIVGEVVLDRARRELRVGDVLVAVPRREFDIADLLMQQAGRVVTRAVIVRELWGSMRDTKSLDVQVGRLRTRLAAVDGIRRIVTIRGVGYRFLGEDEGTEADQEIDLRAPERGGVIDGPTVVLDSTGRGLEETTPV